MNRRHFLGTLLASLGVAAVAPSDLLWTPAPIEGLPLVAPDALIGLQAITDRVAHEIALHWSGQLHPVMPPESLIGQDGMTRQFNVSISAPPEVNHYGLDVERWIEPIGEQLSNALYRAGMTRCGRLPLPPAGVEAAVIATHPESGVCVRGVQLYDPGFAFSTAQHLLRFDVICG